MVPAEKILETAKKEGVDIIGLSGLITPSLDEMVHVAREMQRLGFTTPLLIGGATTSRVHAAVKIEPQYSGDTVHVLDASRSVTVVSSLLGKQTKSVFSENVKKEYKQLRDQYAGRKQDKKFVPLSFARKNKFAFDWGNYIPPKPSFLGNKVFKDFPLEAISERIDWTPFFQTWEMSGKYPDILKDEIMGEEAKKLFSDANKLLTEVIEKKLLTATGVIGFYLAGTMSDDDIQIKNPSISSNGSDAKYIINDSKKVEEITFHFLRQQNEKALSQKYLCLADFICPKSSEKTSDYLGLFAVTAGIGIEALIKKFKNEHDDYSVILIQALADRLAEAFAETMHELVRKEYWGYAKQETMTTAQLIKEEYLGIRPAPGYPACPDHTEKRKLFDLLEVEKNTGITLTENFAMHPASSVSGFYFSHPESKYFGIGKIARDQVEDYTNRKKVSIEYVEKWLSPNLGYNV
jgi:5-methyltetrahydrofolate--homocysteine methyltransferase